MSDQREVTTMEIGEASGEFATRWAGVDFAPAGMVAPDDTDDEQIQCHDWGVYAESAWRGQAFLYWQQLYAVGQFLDIALAGLDDQVCAGAEQKDLFDPYTVAVEFFGAMFAGNRRDSRALVAMAIAVAERLPRTADLLRQTVISPAMFAKVVDRTDIVDEPAIVATVDQDVANALAKAGHISKKAAERIADRIVDKHDREASRKRRDKAQRRKNVTRRDYTDGLGGITITADAEETRLAYEAVEAMIAGVCPNDPRSKGALRSAAAIARLRGLPFTCACTGKETCTATLSTEEISERQARIIVHAVCRKTTLAGGDDEPGFLDGHGPIGADHVRDLARGPDALVRDLDLSKLLTPHRTLATTAETTTPDNGGAHSGDSDGARAAPKAEYRPPTGDDEDAETGSADTGDQDGGAATETSGGPVPPTFLTDTAQPGDPYRPTAALDVLIRALFGTCTVPGCDQPAWHCELDHCQEFNQVCPASGGPTCLCNLNPKCKRHHLLKTHLGATNPADGWIDEQWIDHDGTVWTAITVHGITLETRAENQWLFPDLTAATCAHQAQAPPETAPAGEPAPPRAGACTPSGGLRAATAHKHAWRRAERARLRRERAHADELYGPPPF
ncbi:HNH endonuclease signature motif containing protein [Gordonia sp. (in: high G+C Gram-positive bacteria)]|uniref:HNH endonuclease signature motif containing protein n=1 Tax=Gordonia sp. (in: high G+C Gram-positive bacteria) TaxID=84139 RepID=UPI002638CA36|nr:HNH endonuclease signature motif containing protein [Gordonia sp. (in: high G+C Gram-positive bacteria)]